MVKYWSNTGQMLVKRWSNGLPLTEEGVLEVRSADQGRRDLPTGASAGVNGRRDRPTM